MSTPSPETLAGALAGYKITANGTALSSDVQVVSLDIWHGVNKLPRARLVISDGTAAEQNFPISTENTLIPGATLKIELGYDGQETLVFSGIIYSQGLDISIDGAAQLVVDATDKAMAMTLTRRNEVYETTTDSELASKLIAAAGLSANVASTSFKHPVIVQYYSTDWDLLLIRAQLNSMVVMVSAGKVTIAKPDTSTAPALHLAFGDSILDLRTCMDATMQFSAGAIHSYGWNPATQALCTGKNASSHITTPGNLSSEQLAKVFNVSKYIQQSSGSLHEDELTSWSSAELMKTQLAKIRGEITFQGNTMVKTGCMVTLAGLGDRFNGNAYVSAVHHSLHEGLWRTSIEVGLAPDWFATTAPYIAAPGASGQLPPVSHLQIGTVIKLDADPEGEFRVQVKLPLLQATTGIWARLGSSYASNGFGAEFYPEIGDEVIIACMNGDPRYPVILGSLYSKKNPPPVPPTAENKQKTLLTKSKLRVDFFEDKPAIMISTPAQQSITLDDKAGSITIKDKNGNSIIMDHGGISIKSAADIKLDAKGNITIATQAKLAATAQAGAKLSSPAIVQVKGAMVELNP